MNVAVLVIVAAGAACLVAALVPKPSARHRRYVRKARRTRRAIAALSDGQVLAYLRKINPYVFEELVLESFAEAGYRIRRNDRYSGDGGIDGRMEKDGTKYLVQCKRYAGHIQLEHVRQFAGTCRREKCRGVFVHTGRTGEGVRLFLGDECPDIEIWSGAKLAQLARPAAKTNGKQK